MDAQTTLRMLLAAIRMLDTDYDQRNALVYHALLAALACGIPAGIRIDPAESEWPVVFIELPDGQVSWHLPQHPHPWDGHTTAEKHARIEAYLGRFL